MLIRSSSTTVFPLGWSSPAWEFLGRQAMSLVAGEWAPDWTHYEMLLPRRVLSC